MKRLDPPVKGVNLGNWLVLEKWMSPALFERTTAEDMGCEQNLEAYEKFVEEHFEKDISEMSECFPVICGEWCLFNSLACGRDTHGGQTSLNGEMEAITNVVSDEEKKAIYNRLDKAQKKAWMAGSGYCCWSWKLLIDTVNGDDWKGWDAWDLGRSAAFGWFEKA